MGLNIEKLKAKLQETKDKKGGGGGDFSFWSPKDGRNVIRILPPKDGSDDFYAEARVHYNVGPDNKMVTCGKTDRKSCAVCEFVDALFKTKNKDDETLAKKMKATSRYYFNVIDRTVEEDDEKFGEVLVFGSGTTIFTDVLGIICDPDYGDITDSKKGYDVIITKSGKGLKTEYKTNARPKQTAIGIDDYQEKMIDLSFFAKSKSDEDMEAILSGEEPTSNKDDEDDAPPPKKDKKPSKNPEPEDDEGDDEMDEIEAEIKSVLNKHKK